MANVWLIVFLFSASLAGRMLTMPPTRVYYTAVIAQAAFEAICFATAVHIAITLKSSTKHLSHQRQGLAKLFASGFVAIQLIIVVSIVINMKFSLETASALSQYDEAEITQLGDVIFLDGAIGRNTFSRLERVYAAGNATQISIQSPGGLIREALQVSELIRRNRISVHVRERCASACVLIATASPDLTATPNAIFGFHRGATLAESQTSLGRFLSLDATNIMIDALQANGIPSDILTIARATESSAMHYVSSERLLELGVVRAIRR